MSLAVAGDSGAPFAVRPYRYPADGFRVLLELWPLF